MKRTYIQLKANEKHRFISKAIRELHLSAALVCNPSGLNANLLSAPDVMLPLTRSDDHQTRLPSRIIFYRS